MRTTVTLDDDLAIRLERLSQEQGRTFKAVINEAIRAGLEAMRLPEQRGSTEPVTYTEPVDLGPPARADLLPSQLLAAADEDDDAERYGATDVPR